LPKVKKVSRVQYAANNGNTLKSAATGTLGKFLRPKKTVKLAACSYVHGILLRFVVAYFQLPQLQELVEMGPQERSNVFRRFFAASRYGRLLIQQLLVRSALEQALMQNVVQMERIHNQNFKDTLEAVRKHGFFEEFLTAVREEDSALQKIIEAYDKRMEGRM
jgi:hypothetical protein